MIFHETELSGAFVIELQRLADERGFFARSWCRREFEEHGLNPNLVQCNISYNAAKGTLRGMHYQEKPHEEAKLIRCTRGSIHDVIVDIRPDSPTFGKYVAVQLTADNRRLLYVPEGFAHGFLTLEDGSEIFYQMSEFYASNAARGFRWDDPRFNIAWPPEIRVMSEQDRNYPDYSL